MKYKQGDILTYNNRYRKISSLSGEQMKVIKGKNLNRHFDEYTQYDLDRYGYKLYTPPEEVEPKLSYKPFSPKKGERYFYYDTWGRVVSSAYYYSNGNANKWDAKSGSCFRTREEAEYYRDWLIASKRIMDNSDSESAWEDQEQKKWTIYYEHGDNRLEVVDWRYNQYSSLPPYKSKEEAEQATQDLENEYLVYFGIKRSLNE